MKPAALTETEIAALVTALPDWRLTGKAIERDFSFRDFSAAWAFMTRVALLAEKHNHHPDWSNSYNRVHIALSTHEAGSLTHRDRELAAAINRLV
jgi:4a-hydroxytetrahydrobiopterin dehydratase